MSRLRERRPPRHGPTARGESALVPGLRAACLLALAACLLPVYLSTTLEVTKAARVGESALVEDLQQLHPLLLKLGATAGLLFALLALLDAAAWWKRGERTWSALDLLAAGLALLACHTLLGGALAGSAVEDLPLPDEPLPLLSFGSLVLATGIWAAGRWRSLARRVEAGGFGDADERIRRGFPGARLALHLPHGIFVSALFGVALSLPVAWIGLERAEDYRSGLAGALLLSEAGVGLFAVLIFAALTGVALVVAAVNRIVRAPAGLLVGSLGTVCVYGLALQALLASLGEEIIALGLLPLAVSFLACLALLHGIAVSSLLLRAYGGPGRPPRPDELARNAVLAGLLVPLPLRRRNPGGRIRTEVVAGLLVTGLLALLTAGGLFPGIEDSVARVRFFLATLFVSLAVFAGLLVSPPRARGLGPKSVAAVAVVVAGLAVGLCAGDRFPQARPRVFQYDPLGRSSLMVVDRLISGDELEVEIPPDWRPPSLRATPTRDGDSGAIARRLDGIRRKRPPIILVLWDACRSDRLSLTGYRGAAAPHLPTTPNLDLHREELIRFANSFSQATATSCSLRTMFTGRYSSRNMLRRRGLDPFWTNELAEAGYDTFFLNIISSDYSGVSLQAFLRDMPAPLRSRVRRISCPTCERGSSRDSDAGRDISFFRCGEQAEAEAVEHLVRFLESRRGEGVFAFLHMDVPHPPWGPLRGLPSFGDRPEDHYDQAIRACDGLTGRLIRELERLGLWEEAIFAVFADHGTGLNEHGVYGGFHPWRENLGVPIVLKLPGVPGREIQELVGLIDLGPTLLDIFRPEILDRYEGRSLWPLILGAARRSEWRNRVLFGLSSFEDCYSLLTATGRHYIRHRTHRYEQLYDRTADPFSRHNLVNVDRAATRESRILMSWFLDVYGEGRAYNDPAFYRRDD